MDGMGHIKGEWRHVIRMLQINMCCESRYLDQNLPQTDEGRAELSQEEQTLEEVSPPLPAELRGREKLFRLALLEEAAEGSVGLPRPTHYNTHSRRRRTHEEQIPSWLLLLSLSNTTP